MEDVVWVDQGAPLVLSRGDFDFLLTSDDVLLEVGNDGPQLLFLRATWTGSGPGTLYARAVSDGNMREPKFAIGEELVTWPREVRTGDRLRFQLEEHQDDDEMQYRLYLESKT